MTRLIRWIRAAAGAIRKFLAALIAPFVWLGQQLRRLVMGLLGPPMKALVAVLRSLAERVERLIDRILDWWRRLWRRNPPSERVPEERVGTNGVLLLAAVSVAVVWYWTPVARWLEVGEIRFVLLGFVLWALAVIIWLSRCRADRQGSVARFAQRVARSTGLRRVDQIGLALALCVAWLVKREWQLLPLAWASVLAFIGLLIQPHQPRPSLVPMSALPRVQPEARSDAPPTPSDPLEHQQEREFVWEFIHDDAPRRHRAVVILNEQSVREARESNPGQPDSDADMVQWVTQHAGECVEALARQIQQQCFDAGYSLFTTVRCFVAACQAIPYSSDVDSAGQPEYWRYPLETLADGTGDCEDTSVLLAALFRRAGYRCALFVFEDHVAVGVAVPDYLPGDHAIHDGVRYYYCETTADGWHVGEVPRRYAGRHFTVVSIPPWGQPDEI